MAGLGFSLKAPFSVRDAFIGLTADALPIASSRIIAVVASSSDSIRC